MLIIEPNSALLTNRVASVEIKAREEARSTARFKGYDRGRDSARQALERTRRNQSHGWIKKKHPLDACQPGQAVSAADDDKYNCRLRVASGERSRTGHGAACKWLEAEADNQHGDDDGFCWRVREEQQVSGSLKIPTLVVLGLLLAASALCAPLVRGATSLLALQSDPRPTIYSGQVSFGLLLSAHSTPGAELAAAATESAPSTTANETSSEEAATAPPELGAENSRTRRQIFERSHQQRRQNTGQQVKQAPQQVPPGCSQVQPNALYAGMGAIWASHQANLVGDSPLSIGTYVYDSCNDLDVGQRQSVRIVSNVNAFQQTTCEAPRGSPISLTIAHGDNQLRAIQLLASFRVPVITTREHYALEDYSQLTREQRKFVFSTAPSSRHLAAGALRFAKRVVARSVSSAKLPNQFQKMSSKNALIVISRNLPSRFVAHLAELVPSQVNYELLQSSAPIDQVRSVEALEAVLGPSSSSPTGAEDKGATSESRSEATRVRAPTRLPRAPDSSSGAGSADEGGASPSSRLLSPTILMFITTDEAIDLVTRLRNDLAEVSRYYSLVVATREDISPALRTIFHRGGARLCSGKAFYTISPKPDEVGEFSRYFRDTVQVEGESSDHPLVCEYARYQARHKQTSSFDSDLDDVATEAVIKAVWSAAAAFKLVHKRECGAPADASSAPVTTGAASGQATARQPGRRQSAAAAAAAAAAAGTTATNAASSKAHTECLVRMNKNLAALVQRTLKRLDVSINSTGLQALDGFRLKFDEFNELMTNKFSIKYINKECEITEVGHFSGFKDSTLQVDDELLFKSLESTVPDPWPVASTPAPSTSSKSASGESATGSPSSAATAAESDGSSTSSGPFTDEPGSTTGGGQDEDDSTGVPDASSANEVPKRKRSESVRRADKRSKLPSSPPPAQPVSPGGLSDDSATITTEPTDEIRLTAGQQQQHRLARLTNGSTLQPEQPPTTGPPLGKGQLTMRTLKPFPAHGAGQTLREWLPKEPVAAVERPEVKDPLHTRATTLAPVFRAPSSVPTIDGQFGATPTSLPESGGNTDLDEPPLKSRSTAARQSSALDTAASSQSTTETSSAGFVTMPSIVRISTAATGGAGLTLQPSLARRRSALSFGLLDGTSASLAVASSPAGTNTDDHLSYLRDLSVSPVALGAAAGQSQQHQSNPLDPFGQTRTNASDEQGDTSEIKQSSRWRLRSHLKWISASWFAVFILGANICGALLTLYVLTLLLMRNCDGSLDRENQSVRSVHLLAIIVLFFGSTLFIVYPTPGLCLLRSSWRNFALVLIFGSLLLQTMQARCVSSLGLGGRPNRLNQFLTLLFMVGVQVSFELQRWKYESASYVNFMHQHFAPQTNLDHNKKLLSLNSALSMSHLNPLSSLDDQVTPISLQLSEKYQTLLHEYCAQPVDEFLQSQYYLWMLILVLLLFSLINRRNSRIFASQPTATTSSSASGCAKTSAIEGQKGHKKRNKTLRQVPLITSGKLLASQHETNEFVSGSLRDPQFLFDQQAASGLQFTPGTFSAGNSQASANRTVGNAFTVIIICAPLYFASVALQVHGPGWLATNDLVSSLTMVLIAFVALIGIFMPVLRHTRRRPPKGAFESAAGTLIEFLHNESSSGSSSAERLATGMKLNADHKARSQDAGAFAMFPEFASTGLRRPASLGSDSQSRLGLVIGGGGNVATVSGSRSHPPFANAKESRRNMGAALANLGPCAADSLRSMGVYQQRAPSTQDSSGAANRRRSVDGDAMYLDSAHTHHHQYRERDDENNNDTSNGYHRRQQSRLSVATNSSAIGEKRLIMLDVDPCCPRHGVAAVTSSAWP